MKTHLDEHADALYLRLDDSPILDSEEVSPGIVPDFNAAKEVVGVEILGVSARVPNADLKEMRFKIAWSAPPGRGPTGSEAGVDMKLHYYPETDSLYIELSPRASVDSKEVVAPRPSSICTPSKPTASQPPGCGWPGVAPGDRARIGAWPLFAL